jgi:transcriptional regulator with XRE-family HTH domain
MSTSLPQVVATEIRAEMARQRITQMALAARLGRSQPYVCRRLTGEVAFDLAELELVAEALGVPLSQFMPVAA